jgi:S-adenosylmethionine:tRNA ribosyltransferase-isomerase
MWGTGHSATLRYDPVSFHENLFMVLIIDLMFLFCLLQENNLSNHKMHSENYTLSEEVTTAINNHKKLSSKNKVLTVGTTSTRVLESCAALTAAHRDGGSAATSTSECSNTSRHELISGSGETNIFIYPPYQFKMVDALLTNFHMPGLTPVM